MSVWGLSESMRTLLSHLVLAPIHNRVQSCLSVWICKQGRLSFLLFYLCVTVNPKTCNNWSTLYISSFSLVIFSLVECVYISCCSVSVGMETCTVQICDSTCWKAGSINVYSMLNRAVLLSVPSGGLCSFLHHTSPPMSACECLPYMEWLQLRGAWLANRQIVLPVGRFFRPFVVSFSEDPPTPLSPQLLFSRTWTHTLM